MSGLQQIRQRFQSFVEIREILESLKTLAQIETQKLSRLGSYQADALEAVTEPLRDLLSFHPQLWLADSESFRDVLLVFGSERGFCGDFNVALEREAESWSGPLVLIGEKLKNRFPQRSDTVWVAGPLACEGVEGCLLNLLATLGELGDSGSLRLSALIHSEEGKEHPVAQVIWPVQEELPEPEYGYPPAHNLPLEPLLSRLLEHYFSTLLHQLMYDSLLAENRRRMSHLEGALQHLEQTLENLKRRRNKLRQEEITNEIEVLLMGAKFSTSGSP